MKRLLLILVDAFRYDFFSKKHTPFLYNLSKHGHTIPLQPILGYSDAIRATIFTGTYPDIHNYWIMYQYAPTASPFSAFKPLEFVEHIPTHLLKSGTKFVLTNTLCKMLATAYGYQKLSIRNIPFEIIDLFSYALKNSMISPNFFKNIPSFFDVLTNYNAKYVYLDSSELKGNLFRKIRELGSNVKLIMIYLHYLDYAAHRHGLNSRSFQLQLRDTDKIIKFIVKSLKQRFNNELDVIVFSDHGMANVTDFIDFRRFLSRALCDVEFGNDYLFFLDSTMIRFWYSNSHTKEIIHRALDKIEYGRFLSKEERKKLRIDFSHRYYGDETFLLKPGYSIFPNFISWLKPKAMHAYHPKYKNQLGTAIFDGQIKEQIDHDRRIVKLVDIAPTILDLFGYETPITFEGHSLLRS